MHSRYEPSYSLPMEEFTLLNLAGIPVRIEYELSGPPADEGLRALIEYAGFDLPPDYFDAMKQEDGFGAWFETEEEDEEDAYISFYSCKKTVEINEAIRLEEMGSPLFVVGSDGGGEVFAIDRQTMEWVMANGVELGSGENEYRFRNLRALLDAFIAGNAFSRLHASATRDEG